MCLYHKLFRDFDNEVLYDEHEVMYLQIKAVESFVTLYREGNMTRASAKLYISQQGLSRQIQAMEQELDVVLFKRSNAGVTPTEACKLLYPYFKSMYDMYLDSLIALNDYKNLEKNALSIAFAYGLTNSLSSDFMFEYQRQNPKISLKIEEWSQATCLEKLANKELDAAFLVTPLDQRQLNCIALIEGEMMIAVHKSHPLAASREPMPFAALNGENLITGVPENAVQEMMNYFCKLTGIRLKVLISSSNNLNFINSMTEKIGVAPVTQTMAARITNPEVVLRRVLIPERAFLYYCTPRDGPKCRELLEIQRYVEHYFKTTPVNQLLRPNSPAIGEARQLQA